MANLTFQIPDARMQDLVDAWGSTWRPEIPDPDTPGELIPNPQTQQQYAKEQIRLLIIQRIKQHEAAVLPDFPIT